MRASGRCPHDEFFEKTCHANELKKFRGQFQAIVNNLGSAYENPQRFKAMPGTGLWVFKEFDHRLYCQRKATGRQVEVITLNGWVKEKKAKKGQSKEEESRVTQARNLLSELEEEQKESTKP